MGPPATSGGSSLIKSTSIASSTNSVPQTMSSPNVHTPTTTTASNSNSNNNKLSSNSSSKKESKTVAVAGIQYDTPEQRQRLDKCSWQDRLLYASRMLLGGNNVNGFLRGTAAAQRIKKQRARQVGINKKSAALAQGAAAAAAAGTEPNPETPSLTDKKDKKAAFNQDEEEKLKKEIMNPRTVKKLKAEMEASRQFCVQLHNILRGIIFDVDHKQSPYLPPHLVIADDKSSNFAATTTSFITSSGAATAANSSILPPISTAESIEGAAASGNSASAFASNSSNTPWPSSGGPKASQTDSSVSKNAMSSSHQATAKSTASPGNPEGSTLRRLRKKKLPPDTEPPVNLPEFDGNGRRNCTKKEHNYRLFEVLRFRALRQGDFVAARTTSRDLWILARVLKNYPGVDMAPLEFLQLSGARRDAVFRGKVHVKDVEEKDGNSSFQVARNLILPLPRTYSEAAEWGQRIKKGMRVYAMYPQTTSLYPATVTDSTTYCRDDDDIIVVQFDGEEPDATGQIPKYHIPARFVTLVPRELPASQPPSIVDKNAATTNFHNPHNVSSNTTNNNNNKRKSSTTGSGSSPLKKHKGDLGGLGSFDEFDGNFDALDLDFDKPLGDDDDEDHGFPPLL